MNENIFLIWNGWGLLTLAGVALWQFLHIAVTIFLRSLYVFRRPLALFLGLPSIVLGFFLSGWLVGIVNILLGMAIGTTIARIIVLYRQRNRTPSMSIHILIVCIPSTLVTLIFGLAPWGIVAIVISLVACAFGLFIPRKTWVKVNVNSALEWLTYGNLKDAKDHIDIALREAEMAKNLSAADIDLLRSACEKVASALVNAGQAETGTALLNQSRSLTLRTSPRRAD